ncbi:hypothetical protein [Streptomyces sp. NPDC002619]|uniref:hypothetical protein n=1 Tax=Streptomyces sp. NPDC002619 TaxID=3364655 RepID=UPI00369F3649
MNPPAPARTAPTPWHPPPPHSSPAQGRFRPLPQALGPTAGGNRITPLKEKTR